MTASHAAALLYIGLTLLLFVVLSVRVSFARRRYQVGFGAGEKTELERIVRAQGNFAEYGALFLLGLAGLSYASEPAWLIHLLGILFLIGRVVFAWALSQPGPLGYMPGRVFGMALTWGPLIVAGVLLVVVAVARVR